MKIVPKERKFNGNYFDTKIDRKMFENMSKNRENPFFCAYSAVCCPARHFSIDN